MEGKISVCIVNVFLLGNEIFQDLDPLSHIKDDLNKKNLVYIVSNVIPENTTDQFWLKSLKPAS